MLKIEYLTSLMSRHFEVSRFVSSQGRALSPSHARNPTLIGRNIVGLLAFWRTGMFTGHMHLLRMFTGTGVGWRRLMLKAVANGLSTVERAFKCSLLRIAAITFRTNKACLYNR